MKRYLLDTGALTDYVNKRGPTFVRARGVAADGHRVGVCTPVLGEFFGGLELSEDSSRSYRLWREARSAFTIWPFDEAAAEEFGRVFAQLRRLGRPMQRVDMQLAAVAFTFGRAVVLSKDSDLRAVPGLKVEDWSIPA
jgi:tRNA(fMet)-specific endonuclease VapC